MIAAGFETNPASGASGFIDPDARVAYRGTETKLERFPGGEPTVPGTPIVAHAAELFDKLDRMRARSERR